VDNILNKTISNLRVNPRIAIYIWGPEINGCYKVKGTAAIRTSGQKFEEMKIKIIQQTRPFPHGPW
jgi:uncharacterized protein